MKFRMRSNLVEASIKVRGMRMVGQSAWRQEEIEICQPGKVKFHPSKTYGNLEGGWDHSETGSQFVQAGLVLDI